MMDDKEKSLMDDKEKSAYLKHTYYDVRSEAAFSSPKSLLRRARLDGHEDINMADVLTFLRSQEVYTTHFPYRRPKFNTPVVSPRPHYMYDVDSGFLSSARKRGGGRYFVLAIDTFSRKLAAEMVSNLRAEQTVRALEVIFQRLGSPPVKLRSDRGSEYKNKRVHDMLLRKGVDHVFANPPHKANYAERVIRTLKGDLYKAMQSSGKDSWSNLMLQEAVVRYNNRVHSSTGMTPNSVGDSPELEREIWLRQERLRLKRAPNPHEYAFALNDAVRLAYVKENFSKDYLQKFSTEVYFISHRLHSYLVNRYKLKNSLNQAFDGTLAESELLKVHISAETEYRIERVLGRKLIGGVPHVLVRWLGYAAEFDSYIPTSEVRDLGAPILEDV